MLNSSMYSSKEHSWETPKWLVDTLKTVIDFTVDAAASAENAKHERFWTIEDDGLAQDWTKETVWVNPPYGRALPGWLKKAYESSREGGGQSVVLVPARPDTSYWHQWILPHQDVPILFLSGRLKFELKGKTVGTANFPSALIFFLSDVALRERVKASFAHLGAFR